MEQARTTEDTPILPPRRRPENIPKKCPRCDSSNTKFCYYNNYSLSQPRYFCKACRRYWTHGGTLRNIPVGGGCRKSKRSKPSTSSKSNPRVAAVLPPQNLTARMIPREALRAPIMLSMHGDNNNDSCSYYGGRPFPFVSSIAAGGLGHYDANATVLENLRFHRQDQNDVIFSSHQSFNINPARPPFGPWTRGFIGGSTVSPSTGFCSRAATDGENNRAGSNPYCPN